MEGRGLRADRLADLSRSFTLLHIDRCFSTRAGVGKRTPPLACVRFLVAQMLCHCGQLPPVAVAEGQFSVVFQFSMLKWFQEQGVWGDEIVFFGHSIPSSLKRLLKIPHFLKCNPSPDFGLLTEMPPAVLPLHVSSVLVAAEKRAALSQRRCQTTSGSSRPPFLNETAQRGPFWGPLFFFLSSLLWKMSSIHKSGKMSGRCSAQVGIRGNMHQVFSGRISQHHHGDCKALGGTD